MPYVDGETQERLSFGGGVPETAGELNYVITSILVRYIEHNGLRYQQINDVLGALEGAKLEFYRRVASDYEDVKRGENPDPYKVL